MMNYVFLIGNVAKDPETVVLASSKKAGFILAVNRRYANAQGVHEADFIHCVAWREKAELVEKYVRKGKKLAVMGSILTRSYDTQDGSKRFVTEVQVDALEFLDSKKTEAETPQEQPPAQAALIPPAMIPADDESDLPF